MVKNIFYHKMIEKSLLSLGNGVRIRHMFSKLMSGQGITIAYIGGSVTEGAGAEPMHENCYAYQNYLSIKKYACQELGCTEYQTEKIKFVKAGIGGTPSQFGVVRYEKDVLDDRRIGPDLVFVEFAVNDADDETKGVCYESLVRRILYSPGEPGVILLFSVFMNGWNLQDQLKCVGERYHLPMVSIRDAVWEQFSLTGSERILGSEEFFVDEFHPSNDGHVIMSDCILHILKKICMNNRYLNNSFLIQKERELYYLQLQNTSVCFGDSYEEMRLLDKTHLCGQATIREGDFIETDLQIQLAIMNHDEYGTKVLPNNWMYSGDTKDPTAFRMDICARTVFLVYKDSERDDFGKAEIWLDGELVRIINAKDINWTHCHTVEIYTDCPGVHKIEIRIPKESWDKKFTLLGWGYVI